MSDSEKDQLNKKIDDLISSVKSELEISEQSDTDSSIKKLIKIQKIVAPYLLEQLKNSSCNLYQTRVLDRFASVLNQMISSAVKMREFEIKEEVDVSNPKIQLLFSWFIDIIKDSLEESGQDKKAFFDVFTSKLINWEEKANKKLSKTSFKAIQQNQNIENPLSI